MAGRATVAPARIQDVLDAVAEMSTDVSMEGLLDRILGAAARLVDAEHGYLDVVDRRTDRRLGRSAGRVLDEAGLRAKAPGEGLADVICVPIMSQGHHFGNVYLTGKRDGL